MLRNQINFPTINTLSNLHSNDECLFKCNIKAAFDKMFIHSLIVAPKSTSLIWNYFEKENANLAKCNLCTKNY